MVADIFLNVEVSAFKCLDEHRFELFIEAADIACLVFSRTAMDCYNNLRALNQLNAYGLIKQNACDVQISITTRFRTFETIN